MKPLPRIFAILLLVAALPASSRAADPPSFIGSLSTITSLSSTVPSNGDINPYGVAVVPMTTGSLVADDILVSNFNASSNAQGTGSTIVQINPATNSMADHAPVFATVSSSSCTGGIGLTTALAIVQKKFVVVGSLPTSDGTAATAKAGCLVILDDTGKVVDTLTHKMINGPWDMTAVDDGTKSSLFVSNVLNGTVAAAGKVVTKGTVIRIDLDFSKSTPKVTSMTMIGTGFPERTDAAALVIGPTGLGLAPDGTLYVSDTLGNRVAAISKATTRHNSAGIGNTITAGGSLFSPLGLAIAPNGDILTVNGGDGNIVESTPDGSEAAVVNLDTTSAPPADPGAGTLFGLAVTPDGKGVYFVDDGSNTLNLLD